MVLGWHGITELQPALLAFHAENKRRQCDQQKGFFLFHSNLSPATIAGGRVPDCYEKKEVDDGKQPGEAVFCRDQFDRFYYML